MFRAICAEDDHAGACASISQNEPEIDIWYCYGFGFIVQVFSELESGINSRANERNHNSKLAFVSLSCIMPRVPIGDRCQRLLFH